MELLLRPFFLDSSVIILRLRALCETEDGLSADELKELLRLSLKMKSPALGLGFDVVAADADELQTFGLRASNDAPMDMAKFVELVAKLTTNWIP